MKYGDYVKGLAEEFERQFQEISAEYNFDLGDEFEVALCKILRKILPQRYGVCRGFVVAADGTLAGDDLVIYDRDRFPTLRLLPQDEYDRKQQVPIEAVCAYIEAKYTLSVEGEGGQSLSKACSQVAAVKRMIREEVGPDLIDPYFKFRLRTTRFTTPENWPAIRNPIYGAVFARRVREKKGSDLLEDSKEIVRALCSEGVDVVPSPDLVVAGSSVIAIPVVPEGPQQSIGGFSSPFFVDGLSALLAMEVENLAFAKGVCMLLWALDAIKLGRMPWYEIVAEGLDDKQGHYMLSQESGA